MTMCALRCGRLGAPWWSTACPPAAARAHPRGQALAVPAPQVIKDPLEVWKALMKTEQQLLVQGLRTRRAGRWMAKATQVHGAGS
jgi:hypothetical protein